MEWISLADMELLRRLAQSLITSLLLLLPLLWLALRLPGMGTGARALLLSLSLLPLLLPASLFDQLPPLAAQAAIQLPALLLPLYLGLRHHSAGLGEAAAGLGMGAAARLRHVHLPYLLPPLSLALLLGALAPVARLAPALDESIAAGLAALLLVLIFALMQMSERRR